MRNVGLTVLLLACSNIFMTFAWYAHLKELGNRPWIVAALVSWGIAFFEYMLQVPANRVGYTVLAVGQLKLLQEVITLLVFLPFAVYYLKEPLKLDYLWAALCLVGAVYFVFRGGPRITDRKTGLEIDAYAQRLAMKVEDAMRMSLEEFFSAAGDTEKVPPVADDDPDQEHAVPLRDAATS